MNSLQRKQRRKLRSIIQMGMLYKDEKWLSKKALDSKQTEVEQLRERVSSLVQQTDNLELELQENKNFVKSRDKCIAELKTDRDRLVKEVERLVDRLNMVKTEGDQAKQEVESLKVEVEKLSSEDRDTGKLRRRLMEKQKKIHEMEDTLRTYSSLVRSQTAQLAAAGLT